MQSILSIQSHVVYGYVGNKAAVYPLQYMGYDVWPINTVQFSNHTGYGQWTGEVAASDLIYSLVQGLKNIGQTCNCAAVLSGYMGTQAICQAVQGVVQDFKTQNKKVWYLCDPVIGNNTCYVKPEVLDFFKTQLLADIITPNQYEASLLSGIALHDMASVKKAAEFFHRRGINIVVITGLSLIEHPKTLVVFVSDANSQYCIQTLEYVFDIPVNGAGDLFSSLYLGVFLKTQDSAKALQYTVFFMQKVLKNTYDINARELQVLSVRYDDPEIALLPDLMKF